MALISTSLTLLNVDVYWQQFVVGVVLSTAVLIDTLGSACSGGVQVKKQITGGKAA
jgi:ABC-type xylose transport system permease subunit